MFHWVKSNIAVSIFLVIFGAFSIAHIVAVSLNTQGMYATPTSLVEWFGIVAPAFLYFVLVCLWLLLVR
ncbi:MAG: hypothetical protein AAGF06_04790, partial [Pseudomonadota bacterium]